MKPEWFKRLENGNYWDKKLAHYIKFCCREMLKAKTGADVYRTMRLWTNHIPSEYDWLIKECIPKELR